MSTATAFAEPRTRARATPRFQARPLSPEAAATAWADLSARGALTAYQRFDWIEGILAHLAGPSGARPVFVEVREGESGRVVALVPLAHLRRHGLRTLTWLDLGVCDYAAPALAAGVVFGPEEAAAFWKAVRAALPPADFIRIERIPSTVGSATGPVPNPVPNPLALLPAARPMAMQASGVAIDGDPATLLARLCRPSTLKDLGKQRRRLERAGAVRFTRAATPEAIDDLFQALVEQRRTRFAAMGRFDLLARPEVQAFYRDAAQAGLAGGAARLLGLAVDGEWIAAAFCLVHEGSFHGILLTTTSDERWRNASPGAQIVTECLRWAREEELGYFDFTVGNHPYKHDFGVETRDLATIRQALTPQGFVAEAALRAGDALMATLDAHPTLRARLQRWRRAIRKL